MKTPRKFRRLATVLGAACTLSAPFFPLRVLAQESNSPMQMRDGFETPSREWQGSGDAIFSRDATETRGGKSALRIEVTPQQTPQYPQWNRRVLAVKPGEEFAASVWVRTRDIEGTGAYLALEFLNAEDERIAVEHSRVSATSGAKAWQQLSLHALAPKNTVAARVNLVLHARGIAWFDDFSLRRTSPIAWRDFGQSLRTVSIDAKKVLQPHWAGLGFNTFHHTHSPSARVMNEVVDKRWREIAPSFARLCVYNDWTPQKLQEAAHYLNIMAQTTPEFYLTTWDAPDLDSDFERRAYAKDVADRLAILKNAANGRVRWYCMVNEATVVGKPFGFLLDDLPKFAAYHQAFYDEFQKRGWNIGLLATDAAPVSNWKSIEEAAQLMDGITAIYGGHDYFRRAPDDARFYEFFQARLREMQSVASTRGKSFILGEFGTRQAIGNVPGKKYQDTTEFWDTPLEPLVGLQLGEAAIASMNAGIHADAYWTFLDFPDDWSNTGVNKWGLSRWRQTPRGDDFSTRAPYYAYAMMTRHFRGPAQTLQTSVSDPYLRASALRHRNGKFSVAVVNRYPKAVPLQIKLSGARGNFRVFEYQSARVPQNRFGDLQAHSRVLAAKNGALLDRVPANSLLVYTDDFETRAPAAPRAVQIENATPAKLSWRKNAERDVVYYRVYRGTKMNFPLAPQAQIASTLATHFEDDGTINSGAVQSASGKYFAVVGVDSSGNASRATYAEATAKTP